MVLRLGKSEGLCSTLKNHEVLDLSFNNFNDGDIAFALGWLSFLKLELMEWSGVFLYFDILGFVEWSRRMDFAKRLCRDLFCCQCGSDDFACETPMMGSSRGLACFLADSRITEAQYDIFHMLPPYTRLFCPCLRNRSRRSPPWRGGFFMPNGCICIYTAQFCMNPNYQPDTSIYTLAAPTNVILIEGYLVCMGHGFNFARHSSIPHDSSNGLAGGSVVDARNFLLVPLFSSKPPEMSLPSLYKKNPPGANRMAEPLCQYPLFFLVDASRVPFLFRVKKSPSSLLNATPLNQRKNNIPQPSTNPLQCLDTVLERPRNGSHALPKSSQTLMLYLGILTSHQYFLSFLGLLLDTQGESPPRKIFLCVPFSQSFFLLLKILLKLSFLSPSPPEASFQKIPPPFSLPKPFC
ncbi:hypothetical protein VNO77_38912 [Canavalia gladiata]|uniref:Uncharacterized protein n=1 Tax=Canavalia gladiata TaxID=3824 RepID=A0AAN9KCN1_CANGL